MHHPASILKTAEANTFFMKSKLTVLLALCLFSTVGFAQFSLGIKAGANIGKIDGKSFNDEFEYGYLLGAFLELGKGRLTIQP